MKNYPLYINAFLKKAIFATQKSETNITEISYYIHKFIREPIYLTIKFLYPRLYRLDNIPHLNNYVFENEVDYDKYQKLMIVNNPLIIERNRGKL